MMESEIISSMKSVLQVYFSVRQEGDKDHQIPSDTWDIIVLTTFDELQKDCISLQLQEIFGSNSVFKNKFYIIADPVGKKLGCGGSTLHVIKTLVSDLGPSLYSRKILIIHSGGQSQRLPSYTAQGKIFSPVPINDFVSGFRVSHMIDLKLALYQPFCRFLGPGIFVTCADDIETYSFDQRLINTDLLKAADIVALAHPCDLDTATGHGVYVLPETYRNCKENAFISDCVEVLQKPSKLLMREKKAIFKNHSDSEELVYSDSVFWMGERVCQQLLLWYSKTKRLEPELDAYGHFLGCLGTSMRDSNSNNLTGYKRALFPILKDFNFKLIVLNNSKFYHLGTMEEYLCHFTIYDQFSNELGLRNNTSNLSVPYICDTHHNSVVTCNLRCFHSSVIFSYFESPSVALRLNNGAKLVVEWCTINIPVTVVGNTILSNCTLKYCESATIDGDRLIIPQGFLFHTLPVTNGGHSYYVTVAFEIAADMKATTIDFSSFQFARIPIQQVAVITKRKAKDFFENNEDCSLFSIKLFQGALTPEESFFRTVKLIHEVVSWKDGSRQCATPDDNPYFSMKDIILHKDMKRFLWDRKCLLNHLQVTC